MEGEKKKLKDPQKFFGIMALVFGFITLGINVYEFYFESPQTLILNLIDFIAPFLFILMGIIIIITKKRNELLMKAALFVFVSVGVYLSAGPSIGLTGNEGELYHTLQGALKAQSLLLLSAILFITGIIMFFIGKSKEDNLINSTK